MDKTIKETAQWHLKKMVLSYAEMCGSDKKAIDLFQVSRSTYYHWKKKYKKGGYKELLRQAPDRSKDPRYIPRILWVMSRTSIQWNERSRSKLYQ